ncbi:unnamed protein product [Pleuronectes platessa]|uniref:Uncharacterized protein n=1 Tax=Pleuronectes platessa TaxID=8262 RepID=A0A9N7Z5F4_PLEPL|nr:unnamed protein product [Pleuronectes platessa]
MSNGLHHQEAIQHGNGMICPHHPTPSLPPPLVLALFSLRPSIRVSPLWLALFRPRSPSTNPPPSSQDLLLSSGSSTLIHYREDDEGEMDRRSGGKAQANSGSFRAVTPSLYRKQIAPSPSPLSARLSHLTTLPFHLHTYCSHPSSSLPDQIPTLQSASPVPQTQTCPDM